jgi:hypothetical protein
MKKCSTFFTIKEMQIKTTLRFHLTPVRMSIIKKTTNAGKSAECMGWEEILIYSWWEYKLVQPLWKSV